ncbi:energy transducer TonB [Chromobacterium phragmitis]|uniref:Energy transducer TonB n=1 Tax=Chromobacterium phragmitis TaxID=2202141 RepID=A0A344UK12_9NEIS|nr:energy transducer TonB [Chromobacterium phragmitis]AXE35610.1 energy transducer TonB [Chromobacterium phragmitis]
MADHLHRSRPSASSGPLLWLALAASLLAHLLLFSLGGGRSAPEPQSPPAAGQISIRLIRHPAPVPPPTARAAEADHAGSGNSPEPTQLLSRSEAPRPRPAEEAPTPPAPANPIVRPSPAPAKVPSAPPSGQISTGSLLAQVGALSRGGDNAAADSDRESGQPGDQLGEAARGYPWARYQADWRLKVERIGNLNYPEDARRQGLHGAVTLEVTIAADGALLKQRVSRSSGSAVLDQAAQRIVELSSPFPPFPPALARSPSLRISQKFVFTRDNLLSSH